MIRRRSALLGGVLILTRFVLSGGDAAAQVVISPPILGKTVKPPASAIERAVQEELESEGIRPVKRTKRTTGKLSKCANKMSCLATVGKEIPATHVIHVIVAEREGEVLAQITILSVETKKPVEVARAKSGSSQDAIDRAIRGAARTIGATLANIPELSDPTRRMDAAVARAGGAGSKGDDQPLIPPITLPPSSESTPSITPPIGQRGVPSETKPTEPPPPAPPPARSVPEQRPSIADEDQPAAVEAAPAPSYDEPTTASASYERSPNYMMYTAGGVGLAAGIAGTVLLVLAGSDASKRDETPQILTDERRALHDSATTKQTAGIVLLVGAGVGLGAAAVMALLGGDDDGAHAAMRLGSRGLALSF